MAHIHAADRPGTNLTDSVVKTSHMGIGSRPPPTPRFKPSTLPGVPVSRQSDPQTPHDPAPFTSYNQSSYQSPFYELLAAKVAQDMPPVSRFISNSDELWKNANKMASALVLDQTRAMNGSLDATLIFAGLFSAVNSTLIAMSLPSLAPGASLTDATRLLRLIASGNTTVPEEAVYRTPPNAVLNNVLLSASLLFSLFAAFGAVVGKQWLIYYAHITPGVSEQTESEERRAKIAGAEAWHLQFFLEMLLPGLLQVSLTLFIIGLVDFFWNVNIVLALCTGILAVVVLGLFSATTILAIVYPSCPFQTPLSQVIYPALQAALPKTILPTLPSWSATGIPLPHGSYKNRSWVRGWLQFRARKPRDIPFGARNIIHHPEEAIVQTATFTVKMTDDLTTLRPTLSAILSITSIKMMETLSVELGERLSGALLQCFSQLHRQQAAGFTPETMVFVGLLSRVLLSFSLFGTTPRTDEWWSHFCLETESIIDIVPEIQQLVRLIGVKATRKTKSTPAPIHLAGALLRHTEIHIRKIGPSPATEARRYARMFCWNANLALTGNVPWAALSISVQGIRYILDTFMESGISRDGSHLDRLVRKPHVRDMDVERGVIWDIYVRNSNRQRSMGDQWDTLSEVFDAFSAELVDYLREPDEIDPFYAPALYQITIWESLIKKAVAVHSRGGKESAYAFAASLAVFIRRADSHQRRILQGQHGEELSIGRAMDQAETTLRSEIQKWSGWSSPPDLRTLWASLASKGAKETSPATYNSLTTLLGIDYGDPAEHRALLNEFPRLIDTLGGSLLSHPTSLAEATLWLLVRQGRRWFDHDDHAIHARFLGSNIALGIARTLARQFVRFPRRRPDLVSSELVPLLLVLLKHDVWVDALLTAFLDTTIATALEAGPSLTGSETWEVDEAPLRQELGLIVARTGVEEILGVWWSLYCHLTGSSIPDVWFTPHSVAAVESCIKRRDTTKANRNVNDALEAYVAALDQLGEDRQADVGRLRKLLDDQEASFKDSSLGGRSSGDSGIDPSEWFDFNSASPRHSFFQESDTLPLPKIIRYPLRQLPISSSGVRFNIPDSTFQQPEQVVGRRVHSLGLRFKKPNSEPAHQADPVDRGFRGLDPMYTHELSQNSTTDPVEFQPVLRWLGVASGYAVEAPIIPQWDSQKTAGYSERSLIEAMGAQTPYIGT